MAKHLSDDLTFEHWVERVFDHPVTDPEWYQDKKAELWVVSPAVTIAFITRLFEAAPTLLREFSDAQASQGLWFLASNIFFDELSHLYGEGILRSQRERCISSLYTLFKEYFAVRCSPHLSHINEADANPLNVTCYMWWDFLAHFADSPDGRIGSDMDSEMLATMEKILRLKHAACTESALHGLGHWQHICPVEVIVIIDRFLSDTPDLNQALHTYALDARIGHVL